MITFLADKIIKELLNRVVTGSILDEEEAEAVFDIILSGGATAAQVGAFLTALRMRGESILEITGAARAVRSRATRFEITEDTIIDTCGTGGDMKGTYNVSTATAFIIASCGVPVVKHGNSAFSSQSGSADVLEALGININADFYKMREALLRARICFILAPRYHTAMRYVTSTRSELGIHTIFNLLGPLLNPSGTCYQIVGVFSIKWIQSIAEVLGRLGAKRVWVVHGRDGLDEITTTDLTDIAEYQNGSVRVFTISPKTAGFTSAQPTDLNGGDAAYNAIAIYQLLEGKHGPFRDIVLLNTAASLVVVGRASTIKEGVILATSAIDSGHSLATLEKFISITRY